MTLAAFLVGLVGPLMARWLASVGLSLVTLGGLSAVAVALKDTMLGQLGTLPGDALMLGGLYGIWECVGMVLGAVTFCVTWAATRGFWALAKA